MRHTIDEWKSLAMPNGIGESQLNEWQAQVIIDAIADIMELREQRDRLVEALVELMEAEKVCDDGDERLEKARANALAAVEPPAPEAQR